MPRMSPHDVHAAVPPALWLLVVLPAAVYRLTRLAVTDTWPPAARARAWWVRRRPGSPWGELAVCPWCASPYIAALVLAAYLAAPAWTCTLALLPAWSAAAGWAAARE